MQTTSKVLCLLAEYLQRNRNSRKLMWCVPEVPKLPAKGTHNTFRNPFKTMANRECLFHTQESWFLIIVDYYSKFPFVRKPHNLTARAVVNEINMMFAENGIPKTSTMRERYPIHLHPVSTTGKAIRLRDRIHVDMRLWNAKFKRSKRPS